jgi:N utilization substance protein A
MQPEPPEISEVRRLFHEHVPDISSGVVEIKAIAREPGKLVIVAVSSNDERVDPVASCVGERGVRVKTILRQLAGGKIDVVRWSDSLKTFLTNTLAPRRIDDVFIDEAAHRAIVFTNSEDKQSILGNGGLRLRVVSRLVDWDLQVETG